jgi:Pyridoxamine 5'-phosphate oxidase
MNTRSARQRKLDTLDRLENDVDCWVSTADPATGTPYLVPLSFHWYEGRLLIATPLDSPTSRNLQSTGKVRIGLGPTRDVVLIEATLDRVLPTVDIPAAIGDAYAERTGWDPRRSPGYAFFWIRPEKLQAWREVDELTGRQLMRDGRWTVD